MEKIICTYSQAAYEGLLETMTAATSQEQQNSWLMQLRARVARAHEHLPGNTAATLLTLGDAGTAIVVSKQSWDGDTRYWEFEHITPIVAECNPVITSGLQAFQEDMYEASAYTNGAAAHSFGLANEYMRDLLTMAGPALLMCEATPDVSSMIMKKVKSAVDTVISKDITPLVAILQLEAYLERLKQRAQA